MMMFAGPATRRLFLVALLLVRRRRGVGGVVAAGPLLLLLLLVGGVLAVAVEALVLALVGDEEAAGAGHEVDQAATVGVRITEMAVPDPGQTGEGHSLEMPFERLRGRIDSEGVVVDGVLLTWDEFIELIRVSEGFEFDLHIPLEPAW